MNEHRVKTDWHHLGSKLISWKSRILGLISKKKSFKGITSLSAPVVTKSKIMKSMLIFEMFESLRTGNKVKI